MKRLLCASILIILLVTGCAKKPLFKESYYFQALGEPQQIVFTIDTAYIDDLFGEVPEMVPLLTKVRRISAEVYPMQLFDSEEGNLQLDRLSSLNFRGALEGDIPAFALNTALLWNKGWQKVEGENNRRYYHNQQYGIDVYAPKNGLLLFATDSFEDHYQKSYLKRQLHITDAVALRMKEAAFGIFMASPQAMIDIGLALPKSVLLQADSVALVVEKKEEEFRLGGIITMKTERLANSLSILLKSSYISDKRRNKEPLGNLENLFIRVGDVVIVNDMILDEEQFRSITALFSSFTSRLTQEVW
ncbi:MAG: hypothetical protein ACOXZ4_03050 [Sphaerochaetaceae bacterium]|jgi:hypothetical protein